MNKLFIICFLLVLLTQCREKYVSPFQSPATGYLVIEGVLNSGSGPAQIRLSRTTGLEEVGLISEDGARVVVEGENNTTYNMLSTGNGYYRAANLNLNPNVKYRLRIATGNNDIFLSDYVPVIPNPPIDSISVRRTNAGIDLFVNTANPLNNTRYYQWEYDETWEIVVPFLSSLKYMTTLVNGTNRIQAVYRDSATLSYEPGIDTCWQSNASSSLILGSSAKLAQDVIFLPITTIPQGSIKLSILYSINLLQYGWSKDGYAYLENLKKNTEQLGSIFDPQPSQLFGNIRNVTNPEEPVIGFFNVCEVQELRLFISSRSIDGWNYRSPCVELEIENISDSIVQKAGGLLPTIPYETGTGQYDIITFGAAPRECFDCRVIGTKVRPPFWP